MSEQRNKRTCIGVLAHVDANRREPHKTSLIVRLLAPQAAIKTGKANQFSIGYEEAAAYRKAKGQYLRPSQWEDLTCEVFI